VGLDDHLKLIEVGDGPGRNGASCGSTVGVDAREYFDGRLESMSLNL